MSLAPKPDKSTLSGEIYVTVRASIQIAETDDDLRGVVRLNQCQDCLAEVAFLTNAVRFKGKVDAQEWRAKRIGQYYHAYHNVGDPYKLNTRSGDVEYKQVEAA
jgi:hypothetical protein